MADTDNFLLLDKFALYWTCTSSGRIFPMLEKHHRRFVGCAEPRTPLKLATVGMGPSKRSSANCGRKTDATAEASNDHC